MKLNLGCGGEHKKGYLNVDAFDKTIADKKMQATNLEFEDYSIDEILMSQVIEHLGIARSIYALSECFRVLKNKGKLIIETPDLKKSFKVYLNGEREDRKYILPWIYGVDIPGMQHRFCFPDDLLEEELKKIGFNEIKKEFIQFDKHQPILRIECKKINDKSVNQFITHVRKELIDKKIIDLDDQINTTEKDDLVNLLKEKLESFYDKKDNNMFKEVLLEGAVRNPMIPLIFFQQMMKEEFIRDESSQKYVKITTNLSEKKFLNSLLYYMTSKSGFIGETDKLFEETYKYGKKMINKIMDKSKDMEIEDSIKTTDGFIEFDFFSEKIIMLKSNQIFQRAAKAFNEGNYLKAVEFFDKSSLLYRDQILTFWNLGRLNNLIKKYDKARLNYKNSIKLLDYIEFKDDKKIKKLIDEEIKNLSIKTYNKPITSLRQIYEK